MEQVDIVNITENAIELLVDDEICKISFSELFVKNNISILANLTADTVNACKLSLIFYDHDFDLTKEFTFELPTVLLELDSYDNFNPNYFNF